MTLRIGSLFSGIGGLELGLEWAGMGPTVWQVENDDYCSQVLAKHWPDTVRYGDIREVDFTGFAPVDLICGGFPCQPFSVAGKQGGVADERWMWPEFARCVRALRPRYVVVENVTALLRTTRAFGRILADLAEGGYDAEWDCLPASSVGAPHRRDRVFIVAHPAGTGLEGRAGAPTLRAEQRLLSDSRNKEGVAWLPEPEPDRVGYGLSDWMDRVRTLGNAVVPQVAQFVGEQIMEAERRKVAA